MARRQKRGRPVHGILLLDKPAGGSSNHALQRVKRLFGARKAGHTGSLDPLATGMLPICFGEATKLAAFLLDADKGYETTLKLGVTTTSGDSDGDIISTRPVPASLDIDTLQQICERFRGSIEQVPPMVSAIKINGQRLYKLAREGKHVERAARPVSIHDLSISSFCGDTAQLVVRCSKGTYIRSLVTDIGEAIGCGAHVTALRRTYVSPFEQSAMTTLGSLEQLAGKLPAVDNEVEMSPTELCEHWSLIDALLLAPDAGLEHMPLIRLNEQQKSAFEHGRAVACLSQFNTQTIAPEQMCRIYGVDNLLIGLGRFDHSGTVAPSKVLQWS